MSQIQEVDAAESSDDFVHRLKIALKEAQETRFWLRTIIESDLLANEEIRLLLKESDELIRIVDTIIPNTRKR